MFFCSVCISLTLNMVFDIVYYIMIFDINHHQYHPKPTSALNLGSTFQPSISMTLVR